MMSNPIRTLLQPGRQQPHVVTIRPDTRTSLPLRSYPPHDNVRITSRLFTRLSIFVISGT